MSSFFPLLQSSFRAEGHRPCHVWSSRQGKRKARGSPHHLCGDERPLLATFPRPSLAFMDTGQRHPKTSLDAKTRWCSGVQVPHVKLAPHGQYWPNRLSSADFTLSKDFSEMPSIRS